MIDFKPIIESAGAKYVGRRGDLVLFSDPNDDHVFTPYITALRSPEDIRLALKNHREDLTDPWAPSE